MTLETLTLIHEVAFGVPPCEVTIEAWSVMSPEDLADDVEFMVNRIEAQAEEFFATLAA